jgi:hypothetical protein
MSGSGRPSSCRQLSLAKRRATAVVQHMHGWLDGLSSAHRFMTGPEE